MDTPATWVMDQLVTDRIPDYLLTDNQVIVSNIRNAAIGPKNGAACAGVGYRCHTTSGSGGFSFAYNNLGGCRVQPVIYDYCLKRDANDYNLELQGGRKTGGNARLPSYVKPKREPEPEKPNKKVTAANKRTKK
jgi:hypothetical protein